MDCGRARDGLLSTKHPRLENPDGRAVAAAVDVVDEEVDELELDVDELEVVELDVVELDELEEVDDVGLTVDELLVDTVLVVLVADCDAATVTLYSDNPFGPPQMTEPSPEHGMLQRPSFTGAEPTTRLFAQ